MAKWSGKIGFAENVEYEPGNWEPNIVERQYYGDVIRNISKRQNSGGVNDNIVIANNISIVADPYANNNLHTMKYIEFQGTKWKIESAEVQFPRITISIGDVWNER